MAWNTRYPILLGYVLILTIAFVGYNDLFRKHREKPWSVRSSNDPHFYHKRGIRHRSESVWPQPQNISQHPGVYFLTPGRFVIEYTRTSHRCQDIDDAIYRYKKILFGDDPMGRSWHVNKGQQLDVMFVHLSEPCEKYPTSKSSENYVLDVQDIAILTAKTQWGLVRGLETFSQILHLEVNDELVINGVNVVDFPRFPHRGILLDTARHFIPVGVVKKHIELLAYNKMNVLHWHITDHQSFPIKLKKFPEIAEHGAFHPSAIYSEEDVEDIVEFARKRGIRVIPEVDFPGHSLALSKSKPELFLKCNVIEDGINRDHDLTLNPVHPAVYVFAGQIYAELRRLFRDEYVHIGADETSHRCWSVDPGLQKFIKLAGLDEDEAHRLFIEGLIQEARKVGFKPIAWNDAFVHGFTKTPATVHVWTSMEFANPGQLVFDLTDGGTDVLVSYPWYIDSHTKRAWKELFLAEPAEVYEPRRIEHVLGGEACAWGEHVDTANTFTEIWPMASTVAARLWSEKRPIDIEQAEIRLKSFECILKSRGARISTISPGFCETDWEWISNA